MNNNALDHSLDLLTQRLLYARAQQRRMKRNAERKREILLNSGNVLEYELKDAFSMETMPQKKKKIRISPPPGLFPLLINTPTYSNDNKDDNDDDDDDGDEKDDHDLFHPNYPDDNKILAPTATTFIMHKKKEEQQQQQQQKNKNEECNSCSSSCCCLFSSKDSRSSGCFLIHSCMGCIRGTFQDRVWIRLIAENTCKSNITANQVHLVLSPDHLLPKLILRNTQSIVAPGQYVELYAAFTMTDDLFYSQLEHTLTVAIQYTIHHPHPQEQEQEQQRNNSIAASITHLSNHCKIQWIKKNINLFDINNNNNYTNNTNNNNNTNNTNNISNDNDNNKGACWIQTLISKTTKLDRVLSIFYPSNVKIILSSFDHHLMNRISQLLDLKQYNTEQQELFYTDKEDLLIVVDSLHNNDRCFDIYGLTDRILAQCVTQLIQLEQLDIQNIKYGPPKATSSSSLNDLIISLQDQVDYINTTTTTMNNNNNKNDDVDDKVSQNMNLIAARENTATLLSQLLETRGK